MRLNIASCEMKCCKSYKRIHVAHFSSVLAFLLSLNFLFTRDYYISTRVEIFSTRDENLPI